MLEDIKATQEVSKAKIADLNYRYIPVVCPIELWNNDMSVINSPHVELMRLLLKYGKDWGKIKNCRYVAERQHRYDIGMTRWTKEYIKHHVFEKRYKILKSIKKHGFKSKFYGDRPVKILREPFWRTRFGLDIKGFEIWDGGGRTAASYALGKTEIKVHWYEDAYPGTGLKGKFKNKLKNIKGVWDE